MPLPPASADRLAKVLGMLGSDQPGEVANAARAAIALLKANGATWEDVIAPAPVAAVTLWREPAPGDWLDAAVVCAFSGARLTTWDKKFLVSISQRREDLTEKQAAQLDRIVTVCREHACCTA